jgi:hypothetical protein
MGEHKATMATPATEEDEGRRRVKHVKKGKEQEEDESPRLTNPSAEKKEERKTWLLTSAVSKVQRQGCISREHLATNQLDTLNKRTLKTVMSLNETNSNITCLPRALSKMVLHGDWVPAQPKGNHVNRFAGKMKGHCNSDMAGVTIDQEAILWETKPMCWVGMRPDHNLTLPHGINHCLGFQACARTFPGRSGGLIPLGNTNRLQRTHSQQATTAQHGNRPLNRANALVSRPMKLSNREALGTLVTPKMSVQLSCTIWTARPVGG